MAKTIKAFFFSVCVFAVIFLTLFDAEACRPFGSYAFLEDKEGGIWFTEGDNNAISRMLPDGSVKSYPVPTEGAEPADLALDGDGNIWFVEMYGNKVGMLSKNGKITEYPIPTHHAHPVKVAVDYAGNVWFTEAGSKIGRLKDGKIIEYPLKDGWPTSVAVDADENLWISSLVPSKDQIDQSQSAGRVSILLKNGKWKDMLKRNGSCPMNLTADPKGGIWFSDKCRATIERIDGKGRPRAFHMGRDGFVQDMSIDKDGNVWFADRMRNRIGRISSRGDIYELQLPADNGGPFAITMTKKGDLYFSEILNYNINRRTKEGAFEEHIVVVGRREGERKTVEGETCFIEYAARIADKAEIEAERLEEFKKMRLKEPGDGSSMLVENRCTLCHDLKRILLSRKTDWAYTVDRMGDYLTARGMPLMADEEKAAITGYLNAYYSIKTGVLLKK